MQEVQYKGEGCNIFGCRVGRYKFWWSGERKKAGVGILVWEYLMEDVIPVEKISARLLKMKIVIGRKIGNIFYTYAPQVGRSEEGNDAFWGMLVDAITVADSEVLIHLGLKSIAQVAQFHHGKYV